MEVQKAKAPGIAVTSLVLGILGCFTCLLTGIPAIITGHLAQSKIKKANGALGGRGLALTGTILGYVTTAATFALIPLAALFFPTSFRAIERAEEITNTSNAKLIHYSLHDYALDHDQQFPPDLETLISSGHLSEPLVLDYQRGSSVTSWTYYPGLKQDDYSSIIVAGPVTSGKPPRRILLFVDGSVKTLEEPEAQAKASAQGITLP